MEQQPPVKPTLRKCLKCEYQWYSRLPFPPPKQCPKCKRMDWNIKKEEGKNK